MSQTDGVLNSFESEEIEQDNHNQTNDDDKQVQSENKKEKSYALYAVYKFRASYEEALKGTIAKKFTHFGMIPYSVIT